MKPVDQRHILDENVFTSFASKEGKVFIHYRGKLVKSLKGQAARDFLNKISALDAHDAQLAMAKITGNFKRGNERAGSDRPGENIE